VASEDEADRRRKGDGEEEGEIREPAREKGREKER
jgi:hypothetical protein